MTQGIEVNGRSEKPVGNGGATQRLATTGNCYSRLEGQREDEVVQDPLDRDAGRILEAHQT